MILDTLARADRYATLHPRFARAFAYLRETDLAVLEPGRHDIDGDALFAIVEDGPGRTRAEAKLECHRRYIDIQLVLEGVDEMGWRPLADCTQPATEYDAPASWIATPAGSFCLFFADDAHAPLVSTPAGASAGWIRKVVVKVAV